MANGIIDWCISVVKGKTEAEEKRDLYKSIREDLEDYKKAFNDMSDLRNNLEEDIRYMGKNPNCAYGDFYDTFKEKLFITKTEIYESLTKMESAIASIDERLATVIEKEEYWEQQVEKEKGN
ncbi:MAG: hypothetical protein U0K68_01930 [Agathobacter sp.]|nr:hypothetical protein [Agathobacter sp.]